MKEIDTRRNCRRDDTPSQGKRKRRIDRWEKPFGFDKSKRHQSVFDSSRLQFSRGKGEGSSGHGRSPPPALPPMSNTPSETLATENLNFDKPAPLNPNREKNPKKYCDFHRDHGQDTNNCWELRRQIERAIQSGQLTHLVKEIKAGKLPEEGLVKLIKDVNVVAGSSL
jgi:hypothetical protein